MDFYVIYDRIIYFSTLIPAIVGLTVIHKLRSPYLLLFFFVLYAAIQESFRWSLSDYYINNLIVNFYGIIETTCLTVIYINLINSKKWKNGALIVLVLSILFFIINITFIQGLYYINSFSLMLECLFFIVLASRLYLQLIQDVPARSLLKHEQFLFNTGVFVYFSLNFFIFMLSDTIFGNLKETLGIFHLWDIHDTINLFFSISFALTFWLSAKSQKIRQTT